MPMLHLTHIHTFRGRLEVHLEITMTMMTNMSGQRRSWTRNWMRERSESIFSPNPGSPSDPLSASPPRHPEALSGHQPDSSMTRMVIMTSRMWYANGATRLSMQGEA